MTATTTTNNAATALTAAVQGATVSIGSLVSSVTGALGSGVIATVATVAAVVAPTWTQEILGIAGAIGGVLSAVAHGFIAVNMVSVANSATFVAVENALNTVITDLGGKAVDFNGTPPATA